MGLMMLAASTGTEIEIEASGPDAKKAIDALNELVDAKFHEE
jgi:phosphocarrier protein